jgi:gentisate 1,2-dioxygenase
MASDHQRPPDAPLGKQPASRTTDLLEWLYELRDTQRAKQAKSAWLIKGKDLQWERNRQGKMKWYLHPALDDTAIRALMVLVQEIPPGGRSGVQKTPGGTVMYILEGHGYTLLDGERHDWEAEDVVNIPIRPDGVTVQHVNLDAHQPVQFIAVDLNLVDTLGVDRGAVFEQVEPAPDHAR